jgi:ATP-dependent metalloprotease
MASTKRPFFSLFGLGSSRHSAANQHHIMKVADATPEDARAQAAAMSTLLSLNRPAEAIKRFESGRFAKNQECNSLYVEALLQINNLGKLSGLVDRGLNTGNANSENADIWGKSSSSEGTTPQSSQYNGTSKDRPIFVQTVDGKSSKWWRHFGNLLNLIVTMALLFAVFRSVPGGGRLEDIFGRTVHKLYQRKVKEGDDSSCTFDDVQGCQEAKEELAEIVEFLMNPGKFTRLGARLPKGVLLVGPPGTGKTLLARAVAGEANVPFIYASGSEFDEMFVGTGSMRIRHMFETARQQAPAIVFIDEIDAIGSKRNPRDPQHARMSLNQLLVELDGFSGREGVIVIAATNFPDTLDPALLRPGRFDRKVTVSLPDQRERRDILSYYLAKGQQHQQGFDEINIVRLARGTPGFSPADLAQMVNQAKIIAGREGAARVTMTHLESAKDDMIMGQERKSAASLATPEDRQLTAYHEGGHTLVAKLTPGAMPIHKATIIPRGLSLGMLAQLPERDHPTLTRQQLLARLDVAMGGRVAEELVFGHDKVTTGAHSDFQMATRIASAMVSEYGMSERVGPVVVGDPNCDLAPETRKLVDDEVHRLLEEARARAMRLLSDNRPLLDRLAAALLDAETLSGDQIDRIIQ